MEARPIRGLLAGLGVRPEEGLDRAVTGLAYRSDRVAPGDAFFCIRGFRADGHDYAGEAARRGASVVIAEQSVDVPGVPVLIVEDTRSALAVAAAAFHGDPSAAMDVVGITGTNGKTTTTYLLESIMRASGRVTGLIGTTGMTVAGRKVDSDRTTPESLDLQTILAAMRDEGVTGVAMEVSSHAIDLHRVDAVRFSVAAFTNLTQDHLDYHSTLEEYFSVKRRLFSEFDVRSRVVNIDDPAGHALAEELDVDLTVGRRGEADIRAADVSPHAEGSSFVLETPEWSAPVSLPLAGAFNVSNALVATGCSLALGLSRSAIVEGLEHAVQVPGRLERVRCGQPFSVVVDYAHTPDSLEKALAAMRVVTRGRLIAVFGCGGDRDPEKRPLMGAAAGREADLAIITSDNPRSEDPVGIILEIEDGMKQSGGTYVIEVDRRRAIERAIASAHEGDCVLIAGKGHEDYQIFSDRTIHFDDREVAREALGC